MAKLFFIFTCILFTSFSAFANNRTVVIIGDSLTAGYGISKNKSFPSLIERSLKKEFPSLEIKNAGISGATSASAIKRLKWMTKLNPEIVVLALGANDGLRGFPINSTFTNLENAIFYAKKNNIKVILAGMKAPPNYGEKYTKDFENIFSRLAKKHKIDLIPFLLEKVAGEKKFNQEDAIHPNEAGHKIIAETVKPFIIKNLKDKK